MQMILNLWYSRPEDLPAQTFAEGYDHILSEEERARSRAFHFEKHRCEYLTTRLLVRNALSHYHPFPPQEWKFQTGPYGKPAIAQNCDLRFNLSNTPELVVCLIGKDTELGIDIEPLHRAGEVAKVANEVFSSLELAQLKVLSDSNKLDRALSLWTLKESYIKARGLGLSLPLKRFSFIFGESNEFHLEIDPSLRDDSADWQFCSFNLAGHRVALTVDSRIEPYLQIWEAPPMDTPVLRPDAIPSHPIFRRKLQ
jgi:4'-phosphopantetheinyl transferase